MKNNSDFWKTSTYFKKHEFTCRCGCGFSDIDLELVRRLNVARSKSRVPFNINSACRCSSHNSSVKGSPTSSHLKGLAVDIHVENPRDRYIILTSLMDVGFKRFGVYKNFIHCDIDDTKEQHVIWYK